MGAGEVRATLVRSARLARRQLGVRYRFGGSSPAAGFDCSGLVVFVHGRLGLELPHLASEQFLLGRRVPRGALRPGDLVFFYGRGHVGVYLGRGRFVAATRTGGRVSIGRLGDPWYAAAYDGARRLSQSARRG